MVFLLARLLSNHSASVATLRSRFFSSFNICVAVYPERSEGSHLPSFRCSAKGNSKAPLQHGA